MGSTYNPGGTCPLCEEEIEGELPSHLREQCRAAAAARLATVGADVDSG